MKKNSFSDKIDLQLIRTLHTLLVERSVSKAAYRLGYHQPAVSLALRRLRDLMGDPLLVRTGTSMVPTDIGMSLIEPCSDILRAAECMFVGNKQFDPQNTEVTFRVAANDTLDPLFLPLLISRLKSAAPSCRVEIQTLSPVEQYASALANGVVDAVIGNWESPHEDLYRAPLFYDDVISLVSTRHPAVRRGWDIQGWLDCEHVAPTAAYLGWRGVIDEYLDAAKLQRNIAVRCAHFSAIPGMVASSLLVLTTGRHYCQRYLEGYGGQLSLQMLPCPIEFPQMTYYQLWHKRSHATPSTKWLRAEIKACADALPRLKAEPLQAPPLKITKSKK
jgi:DNA-binding transcriptional LysR family regulator